MGKKLSAVIPTYNCATVISRCLKSISWADEIIIVDMGSTDSTLEICKRFNAKIYSRVPKDGNFDTNRKFGMKKVTYDWILKFDSDEELSSRLQVEIKEFLKTTDDSKYDGYNLVNKIFMFGREIRHGFIKPGSHELKLVREGKWKYNPYRFHQQIFVEGPVGYFKSPYYHYNYRTINEFMDKTNRYTNLDSQYKIEEKKISFFDIALSPFKTFVKLYIIQVGFIDGKIGLIVCILFSVYNLIEKVKVWEVQNRI